MMLRSARQFATAARAIPQMGGEGKSAVVLV